MVKNPGVIFQSWPWTIINAFLQRLPSPPRCAWCAGSAFWNLEGVAPQDPGSLASHALSIFVPPAQPSLLDLFIWGLASAELSVWSQDLQKNTKTLETFFPFWPAAQYFSSPGFFHVTPRPRKLQACVRACLHSETISMSALTHLTPDCYTISWRKIKESFSLLQISLPAYTIIVSD